MRSGQIVGLLDMMRYLTGGSFSAVGNISQAADMFYRAAEENPDGVGVNTTFHSTLLTSLEEIARIASELDLDATLSMVSTCGELLSKALVHPTGGIILDAADAERLSWSLNTLNRNLAAQLQSRVVAVFDSRHAKYMNASQAPFGTEVEDAFPTAGEEISEAAKCLALERNTACVFHLMRAMELAVARLAEVIGTGKATDKEWGKILSDIGTTIEAMPKGPDRNRWSESHSHLYHVKQAWRNDTMHPKKTYTGEQAEEVFAAVRSFMAHLAPLVR